MIRRRATAIGCAVAAGAGFVVFANDPGTVTAPAAASDPTAVVATIASTVAPATTTVAPATTAPAGSVSAAGAQSPDSAPSPSASVPRGRIGTLIIDKLGVNQPIFSGVTNSVFDRGVGYWPGTALPGELGNMVLGGHRTSGARPFWDIQKLRSGDSITVTRSGRTHNYVVSGHRIVRPNAVWILDQTPTGTLTLFTCHPRGSTKQRYVVTAVLQS